MRSIKDLIGKKFGLLTVLQFVGKNRQGNATWLCKCECGAEIVAPGGGLQSGHTKSCGCFRREMTSKRRCDDIAGRSFGRLEVLSRNGTDRRGGAKWLCQCSCGNQATILGSALRSGNTKSCGCFNEDLAGQTFGKLLVVEWIGLCRGRPSWLCRCSCGRQLSIRGDRLRAGKARSCGAFECSDLYRDLTGFVSGRLTVVRQLPERGRIKQILWECRCLCGRTAKISTTAIVNGTKISCGCARNLLLGLMPKSARDKAAAAAHRRRSHRSKAGGSFTASEIDALYKRQKGRCAESSCRKILKQRFHRDHILPVVLGGDSSIRNIQLLCNSCNLSKGARHPVVWAQLNGRLL